MYNKMLEYLLKNNPDEVISKTGMKIRKVINPVFRKAMMLATTTNLKIVKKSNVPKNQKIIYAGTHGFHDDIVCSMKTIDDHTYLLYGSLLDFYKSFHGIGLWINGVILVDRKDKESRNSTIDKMEKVLDNGTNIIMFPEGTWNLNESIPVQKLYPGIYEVAKKTGALVVPIATVQDGNICYAIEGDAYDITKFDEKMSLEILINQEKKLNKAQDLMIYNTPEQKYIKYIINYLLEVINCKKNIEQINSLSVENKYKDILIKINKILDNNNYKNILLPKKLELVDNISLYVEETIKDIRIIKDLDETKENNIYESIFTRSEKLLKTVSKQKRLTAVANLRDIMSTMKWSIYKNVNREEFSSSYWQDYVNDLIESTNGLYDHEIEDVAEYKDNDETTIDAVFNILDNIELTKENAITLSLHNKRKSHKY